MLPTYKHEPFTDFTVEENKQALLDAIKQVESELGGHYPLLINGERVETEQKITSYNPSNKEEIIGTTGKATKEHAEQAIEAASEAFKTWRKVTPAERAIFLYVQQPLFAVANMNFRHCS